VHVAFLIGFFWLLFAIIGVQSFKSSLRRNCVWIDPAGQQNYTNDNQFCGGYLDNVTGQPMPYRTIHNQDGATHKGFLCPQGSMCIEGENPFNGTQSFDNIFQSLELVFVVMSSNTYTDLLYKVADSDYLAGALCKILHSFSGLLLTLIVFAAGIVIMSLWLINLVILKRTLFPKKVANNSSSLPSSHPLFKSSGKRVKQVLSLVKIGMFE